MIDEGKCFTCEGAGWVPNGDIEDGMMTGRSTCPTCGGKRIVSRDVLDAHIRSVTNKFYDEGK